MPRRDRVFLDANVLFSAAWHEAAGLLRLWRRKSRTLLSSPYAVEEARRNLESLEQRQRLATLLATVESVPDVVTGILPADIGLPSKDRPIFLAAIHARATHLLTGDARHFGPLYGRMVSGTLILRPADYLGKT